VAQVLLARLHSLPDSVPYPTGNERHATSPPTTSVSSINMLQIPSEAASLLLGAACYMLNKVLVPKSPVAEKKIAADEEDTQTADCGTECATSPSTCAEPDSEPSPGSEEHVVVQHAEVPDKRSGKQGSSGRLAGVGVLAVAACLVFVLSPRADVKHFSDLSVPSASDIDVQVGPQPEPLTPSGPELVAMPQSEGLAIDSSENC